MGKTVGNGSTLEVKSLVPMSVFVFSFDRIHSFLGFGDWVWAMSNVCGNGMKGVVGVSVVCSFDI